MLLSETTVPFKRYALYERGMRPASYKSIAASLRMLAEWAETEELAKLDHGTVKAFLYWGKEERLWEARTFRNHRQYLMSFFTWCQREGLVKFNPVDGIEKPKLPQIVPRGLSQQDLQLVLNRARWYPWHYRGEGSRNETMLYFLALTGLRLGEMLTLQMTDLDLTNREILVRQGKGQKDRVVPIHPSLVPVMREYLAARSARARPQDFVFTGVKSLSPLQPRDVQLICRKLSRDTGVKFTPHTMRHTFGRLCVEAELSVFKIKEIMGHTQISTTQRYLSASTESIKRSFGELELL